VQNIGVPLNQGGNQRYGMNRQNTTPTGYNPPNQNHMPMINNYNSNNNLPNFNAMSDEDKNMFQAWYNDKKNQDANNNNANYPTM